jgi:hypothetical protein
MVPESTSTSVVYIIRQPDLASDARVSFIISREGLLTFLQSIIHKIISKEEQYLSDLDTIHNVFIKGLHIAHPAVMTPLVLEEFIDEIFSNILEVRECHRRLLEVMYVRQREQAPVIQSVGDIFLDAATEFRSVYPNYVGRWPMAEKRLKEEMEQNPEFRLFLEVIIFLVFVLV